VLVAVSAALHRDLFKTVAARVPYPPATNDHLPAQARSWPTFPACQTPQDPELQQQSPPNFSKHPGPMPVAVLHARGFIVDLIFELRIEKSLVLSLLVMVVQLREGRLLVSDPGMGNLSPASNARFDGNRMGRSPGIGNRERHSKARRRRSRCPRANRRYSTT